MITMFWGSGIDSESAKLFSMPKFYSKIKLIANCKQDIEGTKITVKSHNFVEGDKVFFVDNDNEKAIKAITEDKLHTVVVTKVVDDDHIEVDGALEVGEAKSGYLIESKLGDVTDIGAQKVGEVATIIVPITTKMIIDDRARPLKEQQLISCSPGWYKFVIYTGEKKRIIHRELLVSLRSLGMDEETKKYVRNAKYGEVVEKGEGDQHEVPSGIEMPPIDEEKKEKELKEQQEALAKAEKEKQEKLKAQIEADKKRQQKQAEKAKNAEEEKQKQLAEEEEKKKAEEKSEKGEEGEPSQSKPKAKAK